MVPHDIYPGVDEIESGIVVPGAEFVNNSHDRYVQSTAGPVEWFLGHHSPAKAVYPTSTRIVGNRPIPVLPVEVGPVCLGFYRVLECIHRRVRCLGPSSVRLLIVLVRPTHGPISCFLQTERMTYPFPGSLRLIADVSRGATRDTGRL